LTLGIKKATAKTKRSDLRKALWPVLGGGECRNALWRQAIGLAFRPSLR
jgi:hypothetical protein